MTETKGSPTKVLFDSLAKLYKQGQLLLMEADCLMGERGWEPMHTTAPAALSNSLNSPERWYARWAVRFYIPAALEEKKENATDRLLFVSIHFASDQDTEVDEPIISAGRLLYDDVMDRKTADASYHYWMCKSCFWGQPHDTRVGWRCWDRPGYIRNLKRIETFRVPLYNVTSSEKLEKLVIDHLLAVEQQAQAQAV